MANTHQEEQIRISTVRPHPLCECVYAIHSAHSPSLFTSPAATHAFKPLESFPYQISIAETKITAKIQPGKETSTMRASPFTSIIACCFLGRVTSPPSSPLPVDGPLIKYCWSPKLLFVDETTEITLQTSCVNEIDEPPILKTPTVALHNHIANIDGKLAWRTE